MTEEKIDTQTKGFAKTCLLYDPKQLEWVIYI